MIFDIKRLVAKSRIKVMRLLEQPAPRYLLSHVHVRARELKLSSDHRQTHDGKNTLATQKVGFLLTQIGVHLIMQVASLKHACVGVGCVCGCGTLTAGTLCHTLHSICWLRRTEYDPQYFKHHTCIKSISLELRPLRHDAQFFLFHFLISSLIRFSCLPPVCRETHSFLPRFSLGG